MSTVTLKARIGPDGVLHIDVPLSPAEANREVHVTIEPAGPPVLTEKEWQSFVSATAGSIADPTFRRHEQGDYEHREELP